MYSLYIHNEDRSSLRFLSDTAVIGLLEESDDEIGSNSEESGTLFIFF